MPRQCRSSRRYTVRLLMPSKRARPRGGGDWRDNVRGERLWRSLNYEQVDVRADDGISAAQHGLVQDLTYNNQKRPCRALDGRTPDRVYSDNLLALCTAAEAILARLH